MDLAGLVRKTASYLSYFKKVGGAGLPESAIVEQTEVLCKAMPTWLLQLSQQDFPGAHQNVDTGLVALCLQVLLCYLVYRSTARQS